MSKSYQRFVVRMHDKLKRAFHLTEFQSNLVFSLEQCRDDALDGGETKCEVEADLVYLCYDLTLYPGLENLYSQGQLSEIGRYVAHELCHILTWELSDEAERKHPDHDRIRNADERLVERLSRLLTEASVKEAVAEALKETINNGRKAAGLSRRKEKQSGQKTGHARRKRKTPRPSS